MSPFYACNDFRKAFKSVGTGLSLFALLSTAQTAAQSLTNKELTERLIKLEEDNSELRVETQSLKTELKKNNKVHKKQLTQLKRKYEHDQDRAQFNGFISVMATRNTKNVDLYFGGINLDEDWSFEPDSMIGMQWAYRLDEKLRAIVQATAKGSNNFDFQAEWAYLSYTPTDEWLIQLGRLRLPLYNISSTFEIGFTYPWARPPTEVYTTDVTSMQGIFIEKRKDFRHWILSTGYLFGSINEAVTKLRETQGLIFSANNGPWTLRTIYGYNPHLFVKLLPYSESSRLEYLGASLGFNDRIWDILFEVTTSKASDDGLAPDFSSGIFSVARKSGRYTPYGVLGAGDSNSDSDNRVRTNIPIEGVSTREFHQKSFTLGLRYELTSKSAFKMEAARYFDMEDTGGRFLMVKTTGFDQVALDELDNEAAIFTVGVDAVF